MPVAYEMTSARRVIIVCLVLATIIISSLVRTAEGSRYHSEDVNGKSSRHRHRHRHEGTSIASSRRNHELSSNRRGSPWPQQEDDYEDAFEAEEDDDEDEEEYEIERSRAYHEINYQPSRNVPRGHHSRLEPRFPLRYHQTSGHHGNPWYRGAVIEEDPERRRNLRYGGVGVVRGHRSRSGRDRTYRDDRRGISGTGYPPSRIQEYDDLEEELENEAETDREIGHERTSSRRWRFDQDADENSPDYRAIENGDLFRWRNSRKHRIRQDQRRTDSKSRSSSAPVPSISSVQRMEENDWADRRRKLGTIHRGGKRPSRLPIDNPDEIDDLEDERNENEGSWNGKRSKNNLIDYPLDRQRDNTGIDDRDYENDSIDDGETKTLSKSSEEEAKEEEEENIWKEAEEEPDDEDDTFDDTNYYKTEDEPPYKTFDDIIKSLTSDDPTTSKPTIRREYRNTGIEKYLKRDAYGNMYDSRNATSSLPKIGHDGSIPSRSYNSTTNANKLRVYNGRADVANYSNVRNAKKISNAIGDGGSWQPATKERERKKSYTKVDEGLTRTKSLEQEYDDDYENTEKADDVVKLKGEHISGMQADINNPEYVDEENETETEDETSAPLVTSSPTTTTTSTTTTTTTTTTTPRPVVTTSLARIAHERRDSRSYETSSAPQSNGLQQQTFHKWQSANTRDGPRSSKHGQQNNGRNGKSAEIKEALQHAIKVSREGSCQWPRARVIPVRDVYPSPSTTYIPHCAILHRCSDDTGCCKSEALTCVPKVSHRVELYFYTTSVLGTSVVEKLSFYNHTECECKERSEYGTSSDKTTGTNEHRFTRHHPPTTSPPQNIRRPPQRKPCRCPSEFTPRITPEGECQCNCFENDQSCIRTRRGKGYFSLRDRLCIQNEECGAPICEFGEYMRRQGKCPRKKDKFDAIANYPSNINLHHRFRS